MENENFDEALKNRIKQIFKDYDDGQANEGWNLLREKYPEKKRRDYFFWWISAASLLFMILMIWFFQPETYHAKSVKNVKQLKPNSTETQAKTDSSSTNSTVKTDSAKMNPTKKTVLKTASDFTLKQKKTHQKALLVKPNNTETDQTKKYKNTVFTDTKLVLADSENLPVQASDFTEVDSLQPKKLQPIVQPQNPSVKPVFKKDPIKTASVKKPFQKTSKFSLGIYAGPHINFANGSNTLLGFEAGVSTDFQLSKKLKLSSGLGLADNKLFYQNNSSNNNVYASIPANQASNLSQATISNNTSLTSLNVNLIQLDVPINLIYDFLPGKNSISVLAGLSSGTFVKESYQYNYVNTTNNSQSSKSFQSFYLLKTLNVAAQFGLPIKKYNLQVEPFIKVPLGGTTAQQLKFGEAGINLKFYFQPFKK